MELKNLVDNLANQKFYHGQIYKFQDFGRREPKYFDICQFQSPAKEALNKILDNFPMALYEHQGELVKNAVEKKDTIVCMSEGGGKGLGIDIGMILNVLLEHKTILYLKPFVTDLEMRLETIRERIKKSGWDWIIRAEKADNAQELSHFLAQVPDIIVSTPETVADYYLTIYDIEKESIWFNSLGMLIIEDITFYTPEELSHLQNLISALTFGLRDYFPIFISANELENPEALAYQLTHRSMSAITTDFSLKNTFSILIWMPYLDSKPTEDKRLKVERRQYFVELNECIRLLGKSDDNILIWHLFAQIGSSEFREIKETLLENLKDVLPRIKITICDNLRLIPKDMFRKFNKVFILGLYSNIENLADRLGNLLSENGLAVVIPCENPLSYFCIRSPEKSKKISKPRIVLPENNDLKENYLLRSLCSLPYSAVIKEELEKIWGKDFSEMTINKLAEKGFLKLENEKIIILNRKAIFELTNGLRWGVLGKDIFELSILENGIFRKICFGKYLFPYLIYPEAIYYHGVEKYSIPPNIIASADELRLNLASAKPVLTIPIIKYSIKSKDTKKKDLPGFCKIAYSNEAEIELELSGRKYYDSLEYEKGREEIYTPTEKINKKTPILKLKFKNPQNILLIFRIFLPTYFVGFARLFDLYADEKAVFIIPIIPGAEKFLMELYANLSNIIPEIYENAYNLLITCPCVNGCPLCLKSINFPEKVGPIKKELIRTLAKALKKEQEAEFIIRKKEKGLNGKEAEKVYNDIKEEILHLFKNKLDLEIKNPAKLEVKELTNASGLYDGDVKVIPKIPEASVYDVIAHEYAHNWEFEESNMCAELNDSTKVPFKGKLVSEGFAQWVAFKILDYYGLADYMGKIDLDEYNEYGDGFDLMKYIEDHIAGFYGVIEFVKTGKVIDPQTKIEYSLEKLLKESGIGDKISHSSTPLVGAD
ncbi:MAG: DEAD/DEAH box helicase [Bacteroidales bacterium]